MTRNKPAAVLNRYWPHRGASFDDFLKAAPETVPLAPPAADEVIARVEAVSICSSDIKIVRMGADHPLFAAAAGAADTVLGHEVCLRIHAVGTDQRDRFRIGQRLGLQPAMVVNGARSIIGMDRPGGFAQFLRLGADVLRDYVLSVPETVSAAAIALLEPYGCVERAWRPNARMTLQPGGRALVVSAPGADFDLADVPHWAEITVVGPVPAFLRGRKLRQPGGLEAVQGAFDDILALGDLGAADLGVLCALLAPGGVLLQGRSGASPGPVGLDPARVHYDRLSFLGTRARDLSQALRPEACRFEARPGGVALVHGAGGAMGRIHVHRLLQLPKGPGTVIASSRKGRRLEDIGADFGPLAQANGRKLILAEADRLPRVVAQLAPGGLDDIVVVAPDPAAVATASRWLAPDGLLALFAGFPYGRLLDFDLAAVALSGMRLTGSTGCTVQDMRDVLTRAEAGALDLSANIAAVAGLDALPGALESVAAGAVSGKIIIYPQRPDLPLTPVRNWRAEDERRLTG